MSKTTIAKQYQQAYGQRLEHYPMPRSMFSDGWTSSLKIIPDQVIGWVTAEDQSRYPARIHHRYNLVVNVGDSLDIEVDGLRFTLRTDQMLVVFPYQAHRLGLARGSSDRCLEAHFTFVLPSVPGGEFMLEPLRGRVFTPDAQVSEILVRLLKRCGESGFRGEGGVPLWLAHVLEWCLKQSHQTSSFVESCNLMFRQALAYIRLHYTESLTVTGIAASIGCSPSRLSAVFKEQTKGITLGNYVGRLRFYRAVEMLLNSDMRLGEIAQRCGYRDAFTFSRRFRQLDEHHMSPSVFRNVAREHGVCGWRHE